MHKIRKGDDVIVVAGRDKGKRGTVLKIVDAEHVVVERRVKHALYGKYMTRSGKYHAHDEASECKQGDLVLIEECRPISKTKAWKVVQLVEKAKIV